MKEEICPKCIGAKVVMEGNFNKKGFHYKECNLCKGSGVVSKELEEDFNLSLNEDNLETNDDW